MALPHQLMRITRIVLAALFCLVMLTRLLTPAAANVNLAFAVYPGFEKWFPTYPRYFVFLLLTNGVSYWLTERLARKLAQSWDAKIRRSSATRAT
jgi:hypothetical protein